MAGGVQVSLAFEDGALEPDPTWTDLTERANFVASGQIDRGRQFELDVTDTGTASLVINDVDGILDPSNTTGPYFNLSHFSPLIQIKIDLLNPVTAEYTTIFRGFVEEFDYVWDPSQKVNVLTLGCVDAFAILNAIQMQADGTFGDTVPAAAAGNIFFARANVDDRIFQVLGNANWATALSNIFSGNVKLLEGIYSPGDTVLQVVQECADAEFPGLANVYVDKDGNVTFHGRKAKFDPDGVSEGTSWNFHRWKAGDGAAVTASISDTAQIRTLSTNFGYERIINSAYAAPKSISPLDVTGQTFTDPTSIGIFGFCSWSADGLLTAGGLDDDLNANDECALFPQYYIANYAEPVERVTDISFRSMRPEDPRAAALWALLVGVDVSDALELTAAAPGGGGFNLQPFFIEGVHYTIKALNGQYADVTLSLDLSPQAYFADGTMFGVGT